MRFTTMIRRSGRLMALLLCTVLVVCMFSMQAVYGAATTEPIKADGEQTLTHDGDVEVEVTSDDTKNAVQATNGANVTVNGNVTVNDNHPEDDYSAIGVYSDSNSTVKTENVTANGEVATAVNAMDNSTVTTEDISANGNISRGVSASDSQVTSGKINVDGNYSTGVDANADSTVTADSITVEGSYAQAANLSSNASLTVNGDVVASGTGADGIVIADNPTGTAVVRGDVSADSYGAVIQLISSKHWGEHAEPGSYPGSAVLVVEGDLSGDTAPLAIIPFYYTTFTIAQGQQQWYYYDVSDYEESDFPTIIVQSLTAKQNWIDAVVYNDDAEAYYTPVTDEKVEALKAAILKNVYYIVNADGFNVTGAKEITVNGKTYLVAQESDTLTLTPIIPSGYVLDSTDFGIYTAEKKDDGSYLITARLGGHLVFSATVKAIPSDPEPSDDPTPAENSTDNDSEASIVTTSTTTAAESTIAPQTGDNTDMTAWLTILIASAAALGGAAVIRRRVHANR